MLDLPPEFWQVKYVAARYPGAPAEPGLAAGANCQLYAYTVLEHFGLHPPPLRSSDLWTDTATTVQVDTPQPLDLVLVNATNDPWGAHVGVWVGTDQVLHLCAEVGRPTTWRLADFAIRDRYRTLLGYKRVKP